MEQFVGTLDGFGAEDEPDPEVDFDEVVDGDRVGDGGDVAWLGGLRRGLAQKTVLAGEFFAFERFHLFDRELRVEAREDGGDLADGVAFGRVAPGEGASDVELRADPECGFRDDWRGKSGDEAETFEAAVEDGVEAGFRFRGCVFGELPGGVFDDVFVEVADPAPDGFEGLVKLEIFVVGEGGFDGGGVGSDRGGEFAIAILEDHRERAADEVAEAIGEVGIVAGNEGVVAESAVGAEGNFAEQEVAKGVEAHHLLDWCGAYDVAAALGHFVVFKEQPAVGVNALGQRPVGGHEEGGPIDGVEAHDLF